MGWGVGVGWVGWVGWGGWGGLCGRVGERGGGGLALSLPRSLAPCSGPRSRFTFKGVFQHCLVIVLVRDKQSNSDSLVAFALACTFGSFSTLPFWHCLIVRLIVR